MTAMGSEEWGCAMARYLYAHRDLDHEFSEVCSKVSNI